MLMGVEPELVGRAAETALLNGLIDAVLEEGGTLLVHGEPGIGKSALLDAAAAHARERGLRVLVTAGVQSEARLPFAGLHRLLRPILGAADELAPDQRQALLGAFGQAEAEGPEMVRIALAVLDLLANAAARTPLLVIAEDAHWLDRSTVDVLSFVARRLGSDPIIMLVALRDGFENLPADLGLRELRLTGLDEQAAGQLLDARAPNLDSVLRRRLLEEAAGNPLALVELPLAWQDAGAGPAQAAWLPLTTRLEHAFVSRTRQLTPTTRALLLMSAVDEEGRTVDVRRAAASMSSAGVGAAALAPAVEAGLVDVDDQHVRFRHPLMRSAIYQAAGVHERHAAHAALADVLAAEPDRYAWHHAASTIPPDPIVAWELDAVADRAQRRGGVSVAVAALERAAQFSQTSDDSSERLLRAAELSFELGRQDIFDRLMDQVTPQALGPMDQAQLAWLRGVFDEGLGGGSSRIAAMVKTAEQVTSVGEPDLALKLLWSAALQCWFSDPDEGTRSRIVALDGHLPQDPSDPRRLAILAFAAPVERGAEVMERLPHMASLAYHDAGAARVVGTAATAVGAFDVAAELLSAAGTGLRTQGRLGLLARALTLQSWSAAHRVDLNAGIPVAEEAERLAQETGQPLITAVAQATQAMLAGLRGDSATADALATAAERVAMPIRARALLAAVQHARAIDALGGGRHAEAYEHLCRLHDRDDPSHHYFMRCFSVGDLAEAAIHCEQGDAVAPIIAEMEAIAAETPSPLLLAGLAYARPVLAGDHASDTDFERAARATGAWPFLHARTHLAYGMWLRRRRHMAESRAPLRAARDAFEALGTAPWNQRARQELRASGEQSRRRTADARDELSAQELQIAHMAADGLTNREIGTRLFLSHRTVSSHLYRIFPKLGITSRSELANAIAGSTALPNELQSHN